MYVDIWDLAIDDENREHMHRNKISVEVAFEVLAGAPKALPNRGSGQAKLLLVGPTSIGMVTLAIDPTREYGVWRPRTGYPAKPSDKARYNKMGKNR